MPLDIILAGFGGIAFGVALIFWIRYLIGLSEKWN